jgi:hypothetical protein
MTNIVRAVAVRGFVPDDDRHDACRRCLPRLRLPNTHPTPSPDHEKPGQVPGFLFWPQSVTGVTAAARRF